MLVYNLETLYKLIKLLHFHKINNFRSFRFFKCQTYIYQLYCDIIRYTKKAFLFDVKLSVGVFLITHRDM